METGPAGSLQFGGSVLDWFIFCYKPDPQFWPFKLGTYWIETGVYSRGLSDDQGPSLLEIETEYYLAFHYPSGQEVVLQECARFFSLILSASCPHNCPDLDPQEKLNEDLTYLKYILAGIGEIRRLTGNIAIAA